MRKLAFVIVLALAGCAQLPTSGPVASGPVIDVGGSEDFAFYSPSGPESDESQAEIVSGFINAHIGPQNDYAIAREFLTEDFAAAWNPQEEVLIRSSSPRYEQIGDSRQQVTVRTLATVDGFGEFSGLDTVEARTLFFNLVQEQGEWRIDSAPNLTVVSSPVFAVVFQSYPIYFFDRGYRYLVSDVRWFPVRSSSSTRMVRALLDGPSEWLQGAVRSAIPDQTSLNIDAVVIEDSVAHVDLSSQALSADSRMRSLMRAQFDKTLTALPTVSSVQLLIDRNIQEIASINTSQLPLSPGTPVMLSESSVYRVNGSTAIPLAGGSTHVLRLNPKSIAVSEKNQLLALVNEEGLYLASLGSTQSELVDPRAGILKPHFDADGFLWAVGFDSGINVYQDGELSNVFEQTAVNRIGFAVSPEGSRLIEIIESEEGSQLRVRGVVRDSEGRPRSLTESVRIRSASPQSVSWLGENQIALVEKSVTDSTVVSVNSLLGETEVGVTPPVSVEQITTVGNSIYVMSPSGEIWSRFGNSWRLLVSEATGLNTAR